MFLAKNRSVGILLPESRTDFGMFDDRNGHINAVSVLLNLGQCSPNLVNDSGCTPLHLAASQGKAYIVELLLSHQDTDVVSYTAVFLYFIV